MIPAPLCSRAVQLLAATLLAACNAAGAPTEPIRAADASPALVVEL